MQPRAVRAPAHLGDTQAVLDPGLVLDPAQGERVQQPPLAVAPQAGAQGVQTWQWFLASHLQCLNRADRGLAFGRPAKPQHHVRGTECRVGAARAPLVLTDQERGRLTSN
jgi:hypothetical protein